MQPHATETRELERQVGMGRPIAALLALASQIEWEHAALDPWPGALLGTYLVVSCAAVLLRRTARWSDARIPLVVDLLVVAALLVVADSAATFLFLFLFVCYAAGVQWAYRFALILVLAGTAALVTRGAMHAPLTWPHAISLIALAAAALAAGAGLARIGAWRKRHAVEHEILMRLGGTLEVEKGINESLRQFLSELMDEFHCGRAIFAFVDNELDRVFVWRAQRGDTGRIRPENLPLERAEAFLLDTLDADIVWNSMEGAGEGFGWNRRDARRLVELPRVPGPSRKVLEARSLMAVTFEFSGQPTGRILLCDRSKGRFTSHDLLWMGRIVRHLASPLENLYLLRHLRSRAVEAERSRISRDLHDGILQTLLSLKIQLGVLRRKLPDAADPAGRELDALVQTVSNEEVEFRRFVTDLRPLRVDSADLVDLMRGFAERFRNESGIHLDLLVDSPGLELPDRTCRELFQIYREALNNLKKHAQATHAVVKLWQDEAKVSLMVDDNGRGFNFAGRFTSDELDRLRLGPISIKERTRGVGGVLTVESNPGHGSRLVVEIPVG